MPQNQLNYKRKWQGIFAISRSQSKRKTVLLTPDQQADILYDIEKMEKILTDEQKKQLHLYNLTGYP